MDISKLTQHSRGSQSWTDWATSMPDIEAYLISSEDLDEMRSELRNYFDQNALLVTENHRTGLRDKRSCELPWDRFVLRGQVLGTLMGRPVVAGSQTAVCTKPRN